jgi:undecaprenyl-diphosphatase
MAADLERSDASRPALGERSVGAPARYLGAARRNLTVSRTLARRRRDVRFRIVPYDMFQIANAIAVVLSVFVLLTILLDPYLAVWHATLPQPLVAFFKFLTEFGQSDWILIGTGAFVIFSLLADAGTLRRRLQVRRAVRALAALYVFIAVAASGLIAVFVKYLLGRARPREFEAAGSFAFDFWSGDASWACLPSGHATTAMSLGVALALLFPRLRWVFLSIGFWIAVSRLFTRSHYPSDVLAGCLLGGVAAWLIARIFARHRLVFGFDERGNLIRRRGASGRLF